MPSSPKETQGKLLPNDLFIGYASDGNWHTNHAKLFNLTFSIDKEAFENQTTKYFYKRLSLTFGAIIVPVKARFGNGSTRNFEFATDYTIGPSIGTRIRLHHYSPYYINFLTSLGFTSVAVDSSSTGGLVRDATKLSAMTASLGVLFDLGGMHAGFFTGMDYLSGSVGKQWAYQGKPWVSFGIGVQIFSRSTNSSEKPKN